MLTTYRPDYFIAFISSGIKKKLREGDSQRRGKRSEAICAYICIMPELFRPDCFIAPYFFRYKKKLCKGDSQRRHKRSKAIRLYRLLRRCY